jgi:hypothetical protein
MRKIRNGYINRSSFNTLRECKMTGSESRLLNIIQERKTSKPMEYARCLNGN